ncbi:MAG: aminopeptidase P family N-terminal domain-containing protein [Spirochaetes bacterium]|nr:aminopeptidase P family N-terminal domain-containing protein [Spirochaetota bacterium]
MNCSEKLAALRAAMKKESLDAYIVLTSDAHATEYLPDYWQCRMWLSGFTGSAGAIAVTMDDAQLWADGRYYIQAEKELQDSTIKLQKMGLDGVPTLQEWLTNALKENATVGIDGRTISADLYSVYKKEFKKKKLNVRLDLDLISEVWKDRPAFPNGKAFEHDIKFAGKSRREKLQEVREKMKKEGADTYLISSLDDIAWLYNFRGTDTPKMPAIYSYALVTQTEAFLFVEESKLEDLKSKLIEDGIQIKSYDEVLPFLKSCKEDSIFIDPTGTSARLLEAIPESLTVFEGPEITSALKARKNSVEIKNFKLCYARDCSAFAKFIKWVKEAVHKETLEEADLHEKMNGYRKEIENYLDDSFSIAAYMANAAQMHYSPVKGQSAKLKPEGFLLVDTGGQYYDGTTDVTRTIVLGELSQEMKKDFTLTLKSMIRLSMAKFLYGAYGSSLDILARSVMWENGMDYKSGTGHGLGYALNVHESPPGIRYNPAPSALVKIEEGMVVTNEPGVYKEGKWGIRTENTILAVKDFTNTDGTFMKFETISFCPIDLKAVDKSLLSTEELKWLNDYHAKTYETLSPFMNDEEKAWLKEETKAI